MARKIWVEISIDEDGIDWVTSQRDKDWLAANGWELNFAEIEEEQWTTHAEYIKTKRWDETRKAALQRAGYRCQVCNKGRCMLDVHHRTYERLGRERDDDLIVLCRDCHGVFHANGKLARPGNK